MYSIILEHFDIFYDNFSYSFGCLIHLPHIQIYGRHDVFVVIIRYCTSGITSCVKVCPAQEQGSRIRVDRFVTVLSPK